jgi:hypothetical protein
MIETATTAVTATPNGDTWPLSFMAASIWIVSCHDRPAVITSRTVVG